MNNRLSDLISITVCPHNIPTSIKLQLLKQPITVYQAHPMHFQRISQQNTENLASTKQSFIVGKNLLLNQPPCKAVERATAGT